MNAEYWASGLLVAGISLAVLALRQRWPAGVVAWVWYLAFLAPLKTETTFGLWVVVLVPLAVLLGIAQVVLWLCLPAARPLGRTK